MAVEADDDGMTRAVAAVAAILLAAGAPTRGAAASPPGGAWDADVFIAAEPGWGGDGGGWFLLNVPPSLNFQQWIHVPRFAIDAERVRAVTWIEIESDITAVATYPAGGDCGSPEAAAWAEARTVAPALGPPIWPVVCLIDDLDGCAGDVVEADQVCEQPVWRVDLESDSLIGASGTVLWRISLSSWTSVADAGDALVTLSGRHNFDVLPWGLEVDVDFDGDGNVGLPELTSVLAHWGEPWIGMDLLLAVLAHWGAV